MGYQSKVWVALTKENGRNGKKDNYRHAIGRKRKEKEPIGWPMGKYICKENV
jgi:hypothetical protein